MTGRVFREQVRYIYVRNNPLVLIDPTGLDFYLTCKEKSDECRGGYAGTTTVNEKGKKRFTRTVVRNDGEGGLVDQAGNAYSGNFDKSGFHFKSAGAEGKSFGGKFKSKSAPTTLAGAGIFAGFTGVFNSNGLNTNAGQGSIFGPAPLFNSLIQSGFLAGPNPGLHGVNKYHKGTNHRGGNDRGLDPHLSVTSPYDFDPRTGLSFGAFHYDGAYPYGDVLGFAEHAKAVIKFDFKKRILRKKEVPPPATIPR